MILRPLHGQIVVLLVALLTRLVSAPNANASFLLIAAYAMLGRAQAIHALAFSWLFSMLSPGIAAEATAGLVGRYIVLAAAAVSVFLRSGMMLRNLRVSWPVLATLLLGVSLVVHSLLFSPIPDVSVLKALSWTVAASTILSAWSGLGVVEQNVLARQVFGGLTVLLLCSLPLLELPLGYLVNGTGFQGVLNHPQVFGQTMALLGAWAGSRMLADSTPAWGLVVLFGACLVLVVLSEARAAGIAALLGIVLAAVAGNVLARRSIRSFLPGLRSRRVHLVVAVSLVAAILAGPALPDRLGEYFSKRTDSTNLAEAYDASRGALIEGMWANIQAQPWRGIGFGIASAPGDMVVDRDPILGLPTGAAIEKGVMPLAVLEEVGVFGLLAVLLWLWMLMRRAARGGGMTALAVFGTALLMNLGESVLFSPGGFGMLSLILIGWAASNGNEAAERSPHA